MKGKTFRHKKEKSEISLKSIFVVLMAIFVGLQIFFTINISATGGQISSLEKEYEELRKEKKELQAKLVEETSLVKLREKAKEMGFVRNSSRFYIERGRSYALNVQ